MKKYEFTDDKKDQYIAKLLYEQANKATLVTQIAVISQVVLLWVIISGFKKAEVQVVKGDQETTYGMFEKLKFNAQYNLAFIAFIIIIYSPILSGNY